MTRAYTWRGTCAADLRLVTNRPLPTGQSDAVQRPQPKPRTNALGNMERGMYTQAAFIALEAAL